MSLLNRGKPREIFWFEAGLWRLLGKLEQVRATLDPYEPAIFAIAPSIMPELELSAPSRVKRGETAALGVSFAAATPAARHVLHIDLVNPSGQTVGYYSGNLLAPEGRAGKLIPIALNDAAGQWEIRVKDLLTGQSRTSKLEVF